jgi:hypothetical protein
MAPAPITTDQLAILIQDQRLWRASEQAMEALTAYRQEHGERGDFARLSQAADAAYAAASGHGVAHRDFLGKFFKENSVSDANDVDIVIARLKTELGYVEEAPAAEPAPAATGPAATGPAAATPAGAPQPDAPQRTPANAEENADAESQVVLGVGRMKILDRYVKLLAVDIEVQRDMAQFREANPHIDAFTDPKIKRELGKIGLRDYESRKALAKFLKKERNKSVVTAFANRNHIRTEAEFIEAVDALTGERTLKGAAIASLKAAGEKIKTFRSRTPGMLERLRGSRARPADENPADESLADENPAGNTAGEPERPLPATPADTADNASVAEVTGTGEADADATENGRNKFSMRHLVVDLFKKLKAITQAAFGGETRASHSFLPGDGERRTPTLRRPGNEDAVEPVAEAAPTREIVPPRTESERRANLAAHLAKIKPARPELSEEERRAREERTAWLEYESAVAFGAYGTTVTNRENGVTHSRTGNFDFDITQPKIALAGEPKTGHWKPRGENGPYDKFRDAAYEAIRQDNGVYVLWKKAEPSRPAPTEAFDIDRVAVLGNN